MSESNNLNQFPAEDKEKILEIILATLNRFLKLDRPAIQGCLLNRAKCNAELSNDPAIITVEHKIDHTTEYEISLLGVINGIVKDLTGENIVAHIKMKDADSINNITKFIKYKNPANDKSRN